MKPPAHGRRRSSRKQGRIGRLRTEKLESRWLLAANVTTYLNDLAQTGVNSGETSLTPLNVNSSTFGLKSTLPVDGLVIAQPLFVSGVAITIGSHQGVHNVVFVATNHDSVYAYDADNFVLLWQTSFLSNSSASGVSYVNPNLGASVVISSVPSADVNTTDIASEIGIVATPVIDTSSNTIYLVAKTKEVISGNSANAHYLNQLYALNLSNGLLQTSVGGGAVTIAETAATNPGNPGASVYTYFSGPTVAGSGAGNVGGVITFNALRQMDRPGLTLANGSIVLAFASHGDNGPYHGWILTYAAANLQLTGVFNTTPNDSDGGTWQSGGRVVVDSQGALYFETGNGGFDSTLDANGFPINHDYGDAVVKLVYDSTTTAAHPGANGWGLAVADYFAPHDQAVLNGNDTDMASSGLLILPDSAGSAAHPHLLFARGKSGYLYLIDRDNMGKFAATDRVVEELNPSGGYWSSPTYFNGFLYNTPVVFGSNVPTNQYTVKNGQFSTTPFASSPDGFNYPGATGTISANGAINGILWEYDRNGNTLNAYDAASISHELYTSAQAAGNRDTLGSIVKFTSPMITNGEVFAGTSSTLQIYGLLSSPTAAPPAPTNLTTAGLPPSQIQLQWTRGATTSVSFESDFEVYRSTDGTSFTLLGLSSAGASTYTDATVQPGETYYYRVRAVNAIGRSAFTSTITAVAPVGISGVWADTDIGGPSPGGGVLFSNNTLTVSGAGADIWGTSDQFNYVYQPITGDQTIIAQVSGQTNTNAWAKAGVMIRESLNANSAFAAAIISPSNGLTFQYRTATNGVPGWNNVSTAVGATTYWVKLVRSGNTITGYASPDNVTYTLLDSATFSMTSTVYIGLAVTSHNNGTLGSAAFKNVIVGSAQNALPTAATGLTGQVATGTQFNMNWTNTATNEDGYKIMRLDPGASSYHLVTTLAARTNSFFDTGLMNGSTYSYQVVASNTVGDSAPSNTLTVTIPVAPGAPYNLVVSNLTTSGVTLTWQLPDNFDNGVSIYRRDTTTSLYTTVATLAPHSTTFVDQNLLPNSIHDYNVQSHNVGGYSGVATASIVTLPAAPTGPLAVENNNRIQISWTAPASGASSYNVYRGTSAGGEGATAYATGITGTSYQDVSLANNTTYYYKVTAVSPGGEGAATSEVNASFVAPVGTFTPVSPNPSVLPINQIQLVFSEVVTGLTRSALSLTRNGGGNLVTTSQTLSTTDNRNFTLGNLSSLTSPLGNYVVSFTTAGSGVIDASGNSPPANSNASFVITGAPPQISAVYVSGAAWQTTFLNYLQTSGLGDATLGYRVPAGANQLKDLPWLNITNISVAFTEDVSINTAQAGLGVTGSPDLSTIAAFSTTAFSYNSTTHVATWAYRAVLPLNKYLLSIPSAAVTNGIGGHLDGEFTNTLGAVAGSPFPTGDGTVGGDFNFRFNILPGDVEQFGTVNGQEAIDVRSHFLLFPNQAGYSAFMDTYGKGRITGMDLWTVQDNFGFSLPTHDPVPQAQVAVVLGAGELTAPPSSSTVAPTLGASTTLVLASLPVLGSFGPVAGGAPGLGLGGFGDTMSLAGGLVGPVVTTVAGSVGAPVLPVVAPVVVPNAACHRAGDSAARPCRRGQVVRSASRRFRYGSGDHEFGNRLEADAFEAGVHAQWRTIATRNLIDRGLFVRGKYAFVHGPSRCDRFVDGQIRCVVRHSQIAA